MILSCSLDPRLFQLCRAPGVGLSSPMCTRFLIDSDGVHKRDDTRDVDSKQSDDGIDHTFVSAGGRWDDLFSFLFLSFFAFDVFYVFDLALQNRYKMKIATHLRGGSAFCA